MEEENLDSILVSIKKLLGISKDYTAFDNDIIVHINSVLMICNQLGVGVYDFQITGEDETWEDFKNLRKVQSHYKLAPSETLPNLDFNIEMETGTRKTYVYLKVRMMFDPPTHASVIESIAANIKELEWRINNEAETQIEEVTEGE